MNKKASHKLTLQGSMPFQSEYEIFECKFSHYMTDFNLVTKISSCDIPWGKRKELCYTNRINDRLKNRGTRVHTWFDSLKKKKKTPINCCHPTLSPNFLSAKQHYSKDKKKEKLPRIYCCKLKVRLSQNTHMLNSWSW